MNSCPNCHKEIIKRGALGIFSAYLIASDIETDFINKFTDKNEKAYCGICKGRLIKLASKNFNAIKKEMQESFDNFVKSIPVLTIENPKNWDYSIIGLVSDTVATTTDRADYASIENKSLNKLKIHTYNLGGNAIIGTRMGYSYEGKDRMDIYRILSTYGTAIKVFNTDLFPDSFLKAKQTHSTFEETRKLLDEFQKKGLPIK